MLLKSLLVYLFLNRLEPVFKQLLRTERNLFPHGYKLTNYVNYPHSPKDM